MEITGGERRWVKNELSEKITQEKIEIRKKQNGNGGNFNVLEKSLYTRYLNRKRRFDCLVIFLSLIFNK